MLVLSRNEGIDRVPGVSSSSPDINCEQSNRAWYLYSLKNSGEDFRWRRVSLARFGYLAG